MKIFASALISYTPPTFPHRKTLEHASAKNRGSEIIMRLNNQFRFSAYLGSNHSQHHLEPMYCFQRMRFISWHNDRFTLLQLDGFTRNDYHRLPVKNVD